MKKTVLSISAILLVSGILLAQPQNKLQIPEDFYCKCCGKVLIADGILEKLNKLGDVFIISGYRCPKHNREVGGVKNSQHLYGKAADIKIKGYSPKQVAKLAKRYGFTFIKTYRTYTHIDIR